MEYCEARIAQLITSLPPGKLFTTRECLKFDCRSRIDHALAKMVKLGQILRIARGVFADALHAKKIYTPLEVAIVKARAFGKKILEYYANDAHDLGLKVRRTEEITFIINGCSSSFRLTEDNQKIVFRTASAKRMYLGDTKVGRVVRALNFIGDNKISCNHIHVATIKLNNRNKTKVVESCRWMPWWLSDLFLDRYARFRIPTATNR